MAVSINQLTHGYQDRALFNNVSLEIERDERVAFIGGLQQPCGLHTGATIMCGCGLWGAHWAMGSGGNPVWPLQRLVSMLTLRLASMP